MKLERLYGFADQVELTFDPPPGVQGLTAQKVTLKKGRNGGKLEIAAADNAPAGPARLHPPRPRASSTTCKSNRPPR